MDMVFRHILENGHRGFAESEDRKVKIRIHAAMTPGLELHYIVADRYLLRVPIEIRDNPVTIFLSQAIPTRSLPEDVWPYFEKQILMDNITSGFAAIYGKNTAICFD